MSFGSNLRYTFYRKDDYSSQGELRISLHIDKLRRLLLFLSAISDHSSFEAVASVLGLT